MWKETGNSAGTRFKKLKTKYREVKDHNAETGRGWNTCKFYEQLDCKKTKVHIS